MTSELRPAVAVWDDAIAAWAADTIDTRQAAAAVIEADREAVAAYWYRQGKDDGVEHERAKIVSWLRKEAIMSTDTVRRRMNKALDQIEAGEHLK